ncbi:MAG TPA: 3-hydroxyacyl-CoA dehydrogenase, partial [Dongiaceae bacterium]|nr:3-hydroxyacyl-CoA dehydrogenase [Dongiaceae bacterium]
MSLDVQRPDLTLAIVGCGVMGQGIAQIAAQAGYRVLMFDTRPGAAEAAKTAIAGMLGKLVERGKLKPDQAEAARERLAPITELTELADAHVVIEAIVEALDAKRALVGELEIIVDPDCLIATNTSSLSVTAIAAAAKRPERVAGFHFFNPVPLMKVVEVIDGALTAPWVSPALTALAQRMGHRPVRAKDTPGFLVNHAGRGYGTEALRILGESVADVATIDAILKGACGFRMGPFELLDLTGLDVSHPVMESIYHQFYEEPRFRPSPITAQRLAAGLLGRKSKRGFYDYASETAPSPRLEPGALPDSVWVADGLNHDAIVRIVAAAGVPAASQASAALCILPLLGEDASTATQRLGLDPQRCVGVDALFGLDSHRTLVATPATDAASRAAALSLFSADGKAASLIADSPGAVAQRVLATIVNIASDIAQQRISTPADIDAAVTLGLGYPQGPLAWGDAIGAGNILHILETLLAITGDPRYRPSLW